MLVMFTNLANELGHPTRVVEAFLWEAEREAVELQRLGSQIIQVVDNSCETIICLDFGHLNDPNLEKRPI